MAYVVTPSVPAFSSWSRTNENQVPNVSSDTFGRTPASTFRTGSTSISGVATVNGLAPANANAILMHEATGTVVAHTKCATNGRYTFLNLQAGNYAVCILDSDGGFRGKVIHAASIFSYAADVAIIGDLPDAQLGVAYSQRVGVTGAYGAVTAAIASGAFPSWAAVTWHSDTNEIEISGMPT